MSDLHQHAAAIVAANIHGHNLPPDKIAAQIHAAYVALSNAGHEPPKEPVPEFPSKAQIRASLTPDALVSFIDGSRHKLLKRHLTNNGLTPAQYRERFGLPHDYPMVAPNYSARRSALAKAIGLGVRAAA